MLSVPTSGWIATRRVNRANLRPIDLTDDNEDVVMVAAVAEPENIVAAVEEEAPPAPAPTPAPAPELEAAVEVVVPAAPDDEQELDRYNLTWLNTQLYTGFRSLHCEEIRLNNLNDHAVLNYGTLKHRKAMLEIDRFFTDNSVNRVVDPDLIRYIGECDQLKLNAFDRIRVNLVSLEIERGRVESHRLRLKRKRNHFLADQMACPICMIPFTPDSIVESPGCGHLVCRGCLHGHFDEMGEFCPTCRRAVDLDYIDRIFFKFNHQNEPICRFCDIPFRHNDADDDWCNFARCGHAFHKSCFALNDNACTACNTIIGNGAPQHAYINFE